MLMFNDPIIIRSHALKYKLIWSIQCCKLKFPFTKTKRYYHDADTEINPEESKVVPASLFTRINMQSSEEILRKYLLGGIAWRCLVLLKALGVEVSSFN